jgi:hypothetical protein
MPAVAKERLTLDQLRATECWADLTRKQKLVVLAFIALDGDKTAAVQVAYNTRSEHNAQILSYQVFESPRVVAALTAYYQSDPLDSFKSDVRKAYQNRRLSVAQVTALKLFCELNGWGSASLPNMHGRDVQPEPSTDEPEAVEPVAPQQTFTVGQRITERDSAGIEHIGIIKSLTPDGLPAEVQEVL